MARTANKRITKNTRPERVPLHEQNKDVMTTDQKPGYIRRWVNDTPGRINKFLMAGWAVVEDETKVGDEGAKEQNQALGSGARKQVSVDRKTNQPIYGILMEIKESLYKKDQAAKQKIEDAKMEDLNRKLDAGELAFTK